MIYIIINHFIASRSTQTCSCFVFYLELHAIQQLFFLTLEYYHLLCQECRENFTTSREFLIQVILITITILTLVVQPNPYFGCTFQPMFKLGMFSSSISPCIISSDKCYLFVHMIVESPPLEISMICR